MTAVFERFTDRARRAVVQAQEEARMLGHGHVGTEHLLLGLFAEGGGDAAAVLERFGITEAMARERVAATGRGQRPARGSLPFTPGAKKAMELALREAKDMGHGYIGTEHLLLGLLREQEGVAAEVLSGAGASLAEVRGQVAGLLHGSHAVAVAAGTPRRGRRGRGRAADEALAQLGGVDQRLAAIERWVGMAPDTSDLDQQLAGARRAKEAAIDAQDFSAASELRDTERRLIAEKSRREQQWPPPAGRVSLAAESAGLAAELRRPTADVQRLTGDVQRLAAEVARLTAMVDPPGRAAD